MREIKFRAWDLHNKKWLDSDRFCVGINDGLLRQKGVEGFIGGIDLQQFTGLLDKNGKEIYEGDIVKFGLWCNPLHTSYEIHTGEIEFKWGAFRIKYKSSWSDEKHPILLTDLYWTKETHYVSNVGNVKDRSDIPNNDLEVIGNIFENPDLLEGKERG